MRVILASASPRRQELLVRVAYPFDIVPAHIDETRGQDEGPEVYARRMAAEKALRVSAENPGAIVLGVDTIVTIDGDVLGKPEDEAEAGRMLARLSGRTHRVLTALAWARGGAVQVEGMTASDVTFRELDGGEIDGYVRTGEPLDKAGAYGIQAGAAPFVRSVEGSVTGVIGLPIEETAAMARRLGIAEGPAPLPPDAVDRRMRAVAQEIAALLVARGRTPRSARIIAVGKGQPVESLRAAVAAGARDLGENYVQEAAAKRAEMDGNPDVRWHLIGPLQRNKARRAAATFDVVHTVDRAEVAAVLIKYSEGGARGLAQVNVTGDPAKSGVSPEALPSLLASLRQIDGFRVEGLMTIGPADASLEQTRAAFAELRRLRDRAMADGHETVRELSMGMSGDYDAAISEGSTLVRLGTIIFGPRARAGGGLPQRGEV